MSPFQVHTAKQRLPATVALDLRLAGRVAALAVDSRGSLVAWTLVADDGDSAALARRALRELQVEIQVEIKVRPRAVRVLLGAAGEAEAQVAVLARAGEPGEPEIAAALFAEGYERLHEPAAAALALSADSWLVAACGGAAVEPLAAGLLAESGAEPDFVVDQLLAAADLAAGTALVEYGPTGLLIAARPSNSPAVVRFLPAPSGVEEAAAESLKTLEAAGFSGTVQVIGPQREALSLLLAESGVTIVPNRLPASGGALLPAECELAWRLALRPTLHTVPRLASPRSERRRTSLAWARRATRAALLLAAVGGLLALAGLWLAWGHRARHRAFAAQEAGVARLVGELREIGALATEARRLRTGLAGKAAPWPRLATPVAALARQLPPEIGWERLQTKDGDLEITVAATAPSPRLALLRHVLERSPGLVNLSWTAPAGAPGSRPRQVFRATLRDVPQEVP